MSAPVRSSRLWDLLQFCLRFDPDRHVGVATQPLREALAALAVLALIYAFSQAAYSLFILFPKAQLAAGNLPTVIIDNGFVATPDEEPRMILEDPQRHFLLFITPRGGLNVSTAEYDVVAGLDRKTFVFRDSRGWWWTFPLPHTLRMTIERDNVQTFLESWRPMLVAGIWVAMFVWFWFSRILLALVLAGIVWIFYDEFSTAYKMAIYALGPATMFGLALQWLNVFVVVPPFWVGYAIVPYLAIAFVYLIGGLFALRELKSNNTLLQ